MRFHQGTFGKLALLGALALARPAFADEADNHFAKGRTAFNAGKFDDALREFQAAWSARKTHDLAASMAQAETQLGKHRDAAEHLSYALQHFPVSTKEELRTKIGAALKDAKTHVATLQVSVSVAGAEVLIDGVSIGRAPLDQDVFVDPGTHTIEARLAGHVTASKKLDAKRGGTDTAQLVVVPEAAPTTSATVSVTATATTAPPPSRLPSYIAFGAGGAGLLVGAITAGVSFGKYGDVTKACGEDGICPENLRGEVDAGRTLAHVSTVGFVVAGVGAALGVTLLLIPTSQAAPVRASVTFGPGFIGVKGAF